MKSLFENFQQGLTLVEILIAMLIFSVGIMAAASMQSVGMRINTKARQGMYDTVEAGRQIERLLAMTYDNTLLEDGDDGYHPQHPDHGPFMIAPTRSTIEWEVDDDYPVPNTKRICVTVRWQGVDGGQRSFNYDYVKARDFI